MPEHNKRIIVEGVDFQQVFLFPKMLRAASMSLQPGRMIIGLFMVTALMTFGRIWDGVTTPTVSAEGLQAGKWRPDVDGPAYQNELRNGMAMFTGASVSSVGLSGSSNELNAADVMSRMQEEYTRRRAAQTSDADRQALDESYQTMVQGINAKAPRGVFEASGEYASSEFKSAVRGLISFDIRGLTRGMGGLFIRTPWLLLRNHPWFALTFGVVLMVVCAVGGGAISRSMATQLALQHRLGVRESIEFSMQKWWGMFAAQVLPLFLLALVCLAIMVMGVLMAAPVLDVIGALLYGLAILLGLVLAFLLLGYLFGHSMLVPAVACENCSGPDAMQRAYAYVVTRPLHLMGYLIVALIGLAMGFLVVRVFASITLNVTAYLFGYLVSTPAMTAKSGDDFWSLAQHVPQTALESWHHRWAAGVISVWETVIICMVAAYVVSYYYSASTIGYLLMRRAADGQEMDEIWQPGLVPGTFVPSSDAPSASPPAA